MADRPSTFRWHRGDEWFALGKQGYSHKTGRWFALCRITQKAIRSIHDSHVYAMCIHRWCLSWESCTSSRGGETSCNRWWLQSFTKEASTGPVTVTTQHTLSTLYYFIHVVAILDVTGCTPCFSNVPHVVSFAFGKRIIHTYVNIWHVTIVCLCVCVHACMHVVCVHTHTRACVHVCVTSLCMTWKTIPTTQRMAGTLAAQVTALTLVSCQANNQWTTSPFKK